MPRNVSGDRTEELTQAYARTETWVAYVRKTRTTTTLEPNSFLFPRVVSALLSFAAAFPRDAPLDPTIITRDRTVDAQVAAIINGYDQDDFDDIQSGLVGSYVTEERRRLRNAS